MKQERSEFNQNRNVDRLTPKEQVIWTLYQEGKTPTQISVELGIKRESVSRNLSTIREKVAING